MSGRWSEIRVSETTMRRLREIAALRSCTVNAALEEAIREYTAERSAAGASTAPKEVS